MDEKTVSCQIISYLTISAIPFANLGPLINGERCAPPTLLGTLSLSNGRQRRSGIRRRQRAALQIPCSVRTFAKLA